MAWHVEVSGECIASGVCLALAPTRFALGEDQRSHPLRTLTEEAAEILDAVASCPMEAISVHDTATGREVTL